MGALIHCQEESKLVHPLWKTVWRYLIVNPAFPLLDICAIETTTLVP